MGEACAGGRPRGTHWSRVAAAVLGGAVLVTVLLAVSGTASVVVTFPQALAHATASGTLAGRVLPRARRRLAGLPAPLHWGLLALVALGIAVAATVAACGFLTGTGLARGDTFAACAASSFGINAILTVTISLSMTLHGVQRARLDAVTLDLRTAELERERASTMALEARLGARVEAPPALPLQHPRRHLGLDPGRPRSSRAHRRAAGGPDAVFPPTPPSAA